jgi:hypothetical protein
MRLFSLYPQASDVAKRAVWSRRLYRNATTMATPDIGLQVGKELLSYSDFPDRNLSRLYSVT